LENLQEYKQQQPKDSGPEHKMPVTKLIAQKITKKSTRKGNMIIARKGTQAPHGLAISPEKKSKHLVKIQ
jgi:hypothetical protein